LTRTPKPAGRLKTGPFGTKEVVAALERAGGVKRAGGGHQACYEHPNLHWKVPVSSSWTSLRKGCPILKGLSRTTGVSEKQFLRYLNGLK
jgi:hypothetical protein